MRATRHSPLLAIALIVGAVVAPTAASAADPNERTSPADEVLVRYRADTTAAERRAVSRKLGLTVLSRSAGGRTEVVVGRGLSPATVRRQLVADPRVVAVARNHQRELADEITEEPGFASQWGIHNRGQFLDGTHEQTGISDVDIDGLEALRITLGVPEIVVAVIDDGVDFSHPDLTGRAWSNPDEIPGNGVDDDDNGFVDDVRGWDFCNDDATLYDGSPDGHGTHVAGTIAASLNGSGVLGVAPGVRIMALKFIEADNAACGLDSQAIAAIDYAATFDIPIINASWGGEGDSAVLDAAIADSDALFVAAAGNVGRNIDLSGPGNDFFPAESNVANVLSVAAIDQRGRLASFSNYGQTKVDITAPGMNILSSYPGGWAWSAGTSMAAPHVSGVAALAASVADSPLSPTAMKTLILGRGTTLAAAAGKTATGRLVNAWRVVDTTGPTASPISGHRVDAGTIVGSTVSTTLSWPPAVDDHSGVPSYAVRRRVGSGGWTVLAANVASRSLRTSMTFKTATQFAVSGRDNAGNLGPAAESPAVTATLHQEGTSLARYSGRWTATGSSTASHANLRTSTQAGAWVAFTRDARSLAIVGRQGPTSGKAKVYVDGVYAATIDLYRSTARSRVVLYSRAWSSPGVHTVKLFVTGTSSRPRIDIDGFVVLR